MTRRDATSALLAAALAVGTGCAAERAPPGERPSLTETATARIVNRSWSDVRVSLLRGGARTTLGFVTAGRTASFRVPPDLLGEGATLRFSADPVGSREVFASDEFRAEPGQTVEWTIRVQPEQSSVTVQ